MMKIAYYFGVVIAVSVLGISSAHSEENKNGKLLLEMAGSIAVCLEELDPKLAFLEDSSDATANMIFDFECSLPRSVKNHIVDSAVEGSSEGFAMAAEHGAKLLIREWVYERRKSSLVGGSQND